MATFTVTHEQLSQVLKTSLQANVVPFITSSPAMGKSSIVKKLADDNKLELIDLRLSQLQPYDLAGLVNPNKDAENFTYLPLDEFPLESTPLPEDKEGWLLFLDEFNSADKYTAAASYKLILDRAVGKHKLHPNVRIICAGNKLTDGAITHKLGTAIQSRVTHYELEILPNEWLEWLSKQTEWHKLIHPFLEFRPELITNFDPKTEVITYASPRTWEMLSKQLNAGLLQLPVDVYTSAVIGTVGEKAGAEFLSFLSIYKDLPTPQEIENNPTKCKLPSQAGAQWAIGIHLSEHINPNNVDAFVTYVERMEHSDIKVICYRTIRRIFPQITQHPVVQQSMLKTRNQIATA